MVKLLSEPPLALGGAPGFAKASVFACGYAGQVARQAVPAHRTEGGIVQPDSAFLLTGRCGLWGVAAGEDACPALRKPPASTEVSLKQMKALYRLRMRVIFGR